MFAVITGFNMTCSSVGEVVSADISWTGHGAPDTWDRLNDRLLWQ